MSYKVTINGKSYELPPRTLAVDDKIEELSGLDKRYNSGEITRLEAVAKMHEFSESLAPGAFPVMEEADTNELLKACLDIITVYDAPARKAKADAAINEVKDILNRPEVTRVLELAKMKK